MRPWVFLTIGCLLMLPGCASWQSGGGRSEEANQRLEQGLYFVEHGKLASALASFQLALQQDPTLVPAHVGVGDIYSDAGEFRLALRSYQRASELDPRAFYPQFKVGQMHHFMDQLPQAIRGYLRALSLDPMSFDANHYLATAYLQSGRAAEALPFARKAVDLDHYSQEAWGQLAESLRVTGQFTEAIDAYRMAAEQGPLRPELMMGMARSLIEIAEYERAINVLRLVDHQHGGAEVLERWGFALFQMRQFREALDMFNRGIERVEQAGGSDPILPRLLNGRGVCLMTLYIEGNRRDRLMHRNALDAWRQSLRLDPDQPRIINLLTAYERG